MILKYCIKCKAIKLTSLFYRNKNCYDGLQTYCKECYEKYKKKYYKTKKGIALRKISSKKYRESEKGKENRAEYVKEYMDMYNKTESSKASHIRYAKNNPEKIKKWSVASVSNWTDKNKNAKKAHSLIGKYIKNNKLTNPCKCESCGNDGRISAHHCDYDKPIYVLWLCGDCHRSWHKKHGKGLNSNKSGEYYVPY